MSEETQPLEEPKVTRKPIDLDKSDSTEVLLSIPTELYKTLGHIAIDRGTTKADLIREGIKKQVELYSKPAEQNPTIPDKKLNKVLEFCEKEGGGFEIDGENGFIAIMEANDFKLKDLTPEQWERVKEELQIGLDGYMIRPNPEAFAEKFDVLGPTEEQREWLSTEEAEEEETEEEEEEE